MTQALRLAAQGLYTTQPNPRVGCVIVKDQQLVGAGAHLKAGEAHAEVFALREAGAAAKGATAYVTLEPCNHHGRTPPCVDALIAAAVARVVVAMQDPNPLVAGAGIKRLQAHGITVVSGLMQAEAIALNPGFIARMTRALPYVRCKVAASLDGRTALKNGRSQWITGEAARLDVQHWRAQSCAIITGSGTLLADNPSMSVRLPHMVRQPLRVIVDSRLQTPLDCQMLSANMLPAGSVLIAYASDPQHKAASLTAAGAELLYLPDVEIPNTASSGRVDLRALLQQLAARGVNEVWVEAGQGLNGALVAAGLIDEFVFYYAPKLMGSAAHAMFAMPEFTNMQQLTELQILDLRQFGPDIRLRAKPLVSS